MCSSLLEELTTLERELHRTEVRRDRARLEKLLHPDFVEFGRSGAQYTRAEILNEFGPDSAPLSIHSEDFQLTVLGEGVALLTYRSAHIANDGTLHRYTLRSSIWIHAGVGWQMRFHQGTPKQEDK